MRWTIVCLLAACAASLADDARNDTPPTYSDSEYAVCAACHLPDGNGVPGAFPPLRNRSAAMASMEDGREYLIAVVSYGLMGTIKAGGTTYAGVMPGHKETMPAELIAAVLNYVVFELNDTNDAAQGIEPFTVAEVNKVQSGITGGSPMTTSQIRSRLLQRHGEQWPQ